MLQSKTNCYFCSQRTKSQKILWLFVIAIDAAPSASLMPQVLLLVFLVTIFSCMQIYSEASTMANAIECFGCFAIVLHIFCVPTNQNDSQKKNTMQINYIY